MIDLASPQEVADALLAHLRSSQGAQTLEFAERPERVPGGNRTFVYGFELANAADGFDQPLILRIARSQGGEKTIALEGAIQSALFQLGYPTPRILASSDDPDVLGGPFQIMQRLPGKALVFNDPPEDMTGATIFRQVLPELGQLLFGRWPNVLAELQLKLHNLDVEQFVAKVEAAGHLVGALTLEAELRRRSAEVEEHDHDGLRSAMAWLVENCPSDNEDRSICHGDFFPNQVLVNDEGGSGVIDWGDVFIGPGELDVGIVKAGLETLPTPLGSVGFALQKWLGRKVVAAYEALRPLDPSLIEYGQAFRCAGTLLSVATRRLNQRAGLEIGPNPFDDPIGERRLIDSLRTLTGVSASVPAASVET
jgi:aminoglycoside phosphotransferase (APT) family kinase protein